MLARVRYPAPPDWGGADGENYHAAHFATGLGYRTGKTWSPDKKTVTGEFAALSEAIRAWTKSGIDQRTPLLADLAKRARHILARLEREPK